MQDLSAYRVLLLETFKRDGSGVITPVWFIQEGDTIYTSTPSETWKAKRLRGNPRARIAGADAAEQPATDWFDVTGRFVDGVEAQRIYTVIDRRYGGYMSRFDAEHRFKRVIIALDPA